MQEPNTSDGFVSKAEKPQSSEAQFAETSWCFCSSGSSAIDLGVLLLCAVGLGSQQ